VQRLWLQSMTPQAIRDGFDSLRSDAQMQGLADAARSRSEADWLVGINGTRAMTAFNSRDGGFFLTTVGRVQTPTLSRGGRARGKDPQVRQPRLLGNPRQLPAEAGDYPASGSTPSGRRATTPRPADRVWTQAEAQAIADAVRGKAATVTEESKPTTQASPAAVRPDQPAARGQRQVRFFSAKTTLALAQSLYERHKALTYPRTDSRALPEDYLGVVKQTFEMLADSGMAPGPLCAPGAGRQGYIKPSKRIFDNSKVSDHFAIIPTLQAPSGLSEAEQKLYDLVVQALHGGVLPERRIPGHHPHLQVAAATSFKTEGKVLVKPGWLAIYGKEAADEVEGAKDGDKGQNLVPVQPGEMVRAENRSSPRA
jgi:DNA topoisomerase-3